jgi:hypothetical protein
MPGQPAAFADGEITIYCDDADYGHSFKFKVSSFTFVLDRDQSDLGT